MTEASWETADLNRPIYAADLIISALSRTPDNPAVNIIGQREMTAREMSEMVSRYSQALASKGLTQGKQLSVLALNRP
jgi:fatty-acyl-CoA synthase